MVVCDAVGACAARSCDCDMAQGFCKKSGSFLLSGLQRVYQYHASKSEDYRIKSFCAIMQNKEIFCVEGSGESGKGMSCDESLFFVDVISGKKRARNR